MIEVPHVEYIERIEEVTTQKIQKKIVQVPKIEVTERIIEIPKHGEALVACQTLHASNGSFRSPTV